jgi:ribulose-5-phosphate 4-epimerase/fuculose-1-phosphate aldolase
MDINADLKTSLERLALGCRILELEGHGDMSLGHVSLRDPDGRGFWLKCNRIGLEEVHSIDDFVLVDFEGRQIAGPGGRHSEWPIHSEILIKRPDAQVVAHTHPRHATVLSGCLDRFTPYTLDADYFGNLPVLRETAALIITRDEGQALANAIGDGDVVMMANHGVTFCGRSIEHAICVGVFLERAARLEVIARSASLPAPSLSEESRAKRMSQIMTPVHWSHSFDYFARRVEASEARVS